MTNQSYAYATIKALLAIGGPAGIRTSLEGGYGHWLAPGESTKLTFNPGHPLPTGDYQLKLQVASREGTPAVVREMKFSLEQSQLTSSH